jgi:hypothetical protein
MSIIAAVISTRNGIVASDGRIFGPVHIENGKPVGLAQIKSDAFDKTFSLTDGRVIGAFCGLMEFSGQTSSEHIREIVANSPDVTLASLVTKVRNELEIRLAGIPQQEVIFTSRNIDLLLLGTNQCKRPEMQIVAISFFPQNDKILSKIETLPAGKTNRYYVYGEDRAKQAASHVFNKNQAPNKDATFLRKLTTQAIQIGIKTAGPHQHGTERSCGGNIFFQLTSV